MTEPAPLAGPFEPVNRRVPPGGARRPWQTAEVVEVRPETSRAKTFRLALPGWTPHVPGQHYVVRLTAPDGYVAQRDYSVASPPDDEGVVELTVDRLDDGEVSGHLHDVVEVGDRLDLRGPFGGFFIWRGDVPALLVGGGSGVVPLMAMLRHRRRRRLAVPLHLVVSARSPEELLYAEELGEQTSVVFTRAVQRGHPRPAGRLRVEDLAPHVQPGVEAYVCGSDPFVEAAAALLEQAGQPPQRIRVERFGTGAAG